MGVDTKLFLSHRWQPSEIVKVLERTQGIEVETKSYGGINVIGTYTLEFEGRHIIMLCDGSTPIGPAIELIARSRPETIQMFRNIADVFGGILQPEDDREVYEFIDGAMFEENALPYFVRYAIINDGIDPDNIEALLESKKHWHEEFEPGGSK